MSVSEIHGIYATRLFTQDMGSAVVLDGVAQQTLAIDSSVQRDASSGVAYPRHSFIRGQVVNGSLMTNRLDDWFDEIGFTGKKIIEDTGKPGLVLYGQLYDESTAGRATGSSHRSFTVARGYIVPRRLSVDHQGDASLDYDIFAIYDGTNNPVVIAESQSLPSLSGDDKRFAMGSIQLGGTTFDGCRSWELDFGASVRVEGADSDIWPTFVSVEGWTPSLTFRGVKSKWFADSGGIPMAGLACTHANTTLYLRKRAEAGTHFVANGTAEHIKITAAGLAHVETVSDATSGASSECSISLPLKYDGTNVPAVITTAIAIT